MTITSTVTAVTHNGNGAATSFPFAFLIPASTDIEVIFTSTAGVETTKTYSTHYTVTGFNDPNGGSVTYPVSGSALATGEKLTIRRVTSVKQETDLVTGASFYAATVEEAFDKLTMIAQEQSEELDRCVKVDISSGEDPAALLDSIDTSAVAAAASASTASTAASTATTQAGIATTQAGLAATARTAAETAETNAETAQAAAEAARDLAQGYATAADVAKIEWQGAWLTSTAYALNDAVSNGGSSYICISAHTSGTFATDLAALKWEVLAQKGTDGVGTGDLLAANNLSDLASAATARTNLGLAIGTDVLAPTGSGGSLTGIGLQGLQTVWVPAVAMVSRTTNGAASGTAESTTNKVMTKSLDFDTATQEFAQFTVRFPKSWDEGTVTFAPTWTAASGSGGVVFGLAGVALSDDDAIDTAYGTAQTSTDTLITALDIHVGPTSSAITIAGTPAVGDWVSFQANRTVADGSDTLGVDAKLLGITLLFTTNAGNDA